MPRVTLQTIADRVGVSRMTVSNAFSRPDQLSTELRARILATADELGYVGPDPSARALARRTTGAVGVLLTDSLQYAFTDEVSTRFLASIVEQLAPTGLALTLLTSYVGDDVLPARDVAMDGAIVYSCHVESPARDVLLRRKLPLVFVDQHPTPGVASVNVDDRGGARQGAQHLVDLGHRRIDIVAIKLQSENAPTSPSIGYPQRQRLAGWNEALEPAGIVPRIVEAVDNSVDDGAAAAEELLAHDDPPTAILCFSDVVAVGAIRAAEARGLVVPRDLSVVGFDDGAVALWSKPSLTTVRQDVAEKGRLAAEALTKAIEHDRAGTKGRARHHLLPTELVVRDSTAPPPATAAGRA